MSNIQMRPCSREDLAAVYEIESACFPHGAFPYFVIVQYFDLFADTFFVAVSNNSCVGFVIFGRSSSEPNTAWLLDIAVAPSHHQRGIARDLLRVGLEQLRSGDTNSFRATVLPTNTASLMLLQRSGFIVEREDTTYFGANEPRLLLRLNL